MSFQDDIQGKNTQLFPIVEIDGIWYSTNNVTVKEFVFNPNDWLNPSLINRYCKPILMNIPSIKESVDIESRKFKISNVSLQFNNFPFDGVRFSDQLSETSLINTEATIYFKSPSELKEVYKGIIRRISHDDTKVKVELEDLTEKKSHKDLPSEYLGDGEDVPDKYKNKPIPMVYGHVDRTPFVISGSFNKFQVDSKIIKEFIELNSGYTDKDDGAIILDPLRVDIDGEFFYVRKEGQYEYGDNSINFLPDVLALVDDPEEEASLICRKIATPRFTINNPQHSSSLNNEDYLDGIQYTIDNINAITDGSLDTNPIGLLGRRSWDVAPPGAGNAYASFNNGRESLLLGLNMDVTPQHDTLDGNNKIIGFKINGYNLPKFLGYKTLMPTVDVGGLDGKFGDTVTAGSSSEHLDEAGGYNLIWANNCPHANIIEEVFGFLTVGNPDFADTPPSSYNPELAAIQLNYYNETSDVFGDEELIDNRGGEMDLPFILFRGGLNNSFNIEFRVVSNFQVISGFHDFEPRVEITGNINEVGLLVESQAIKVFNKDFYANVKGRINIYDDHPANRDIYAYSSEELIEFIMNNDLYALMTESLQGYIDIFLTLGVIQNSHLIQLRTWILNSGYNVVTTIEFIENPIDIIYDLVRSELGHDAIDEVEYNQAKDAHDGWKFGFTVTKKTNSKKLIQEIAKSTKCFPKFKNDGTFGFNTIKDNYTVEEYKAYTTTLIKESEVISYSFKKTKPEQIYKNVTVSYNKDYAQDSYLKTTDPNNLGSYDLGADPYYGIEDSSDAHLEFESDYIRHDSESDEQTADKLASFLSKQYRNDHLLFNLKLPLQYINLEIGDLVKFRDLFQGVKAYGIDYRLIQNPTSYGGNTPASWGQYYYPLFMVTSTTKNLDSVSIECMQLHHLTGGSQEENLAWLDFTETGDFYFPDADPIVIIPPAEDEEVILPDEGEQVEVPSGDYHFEDNIPYGELVFIKEDGVLLFDFTIYSFFSVGNLIRISDDENNVNEFEIFGINSDNSGSRLMLKPIDIEGFGELFSITSMSDSGDLLITELSWQEVYPLGDVNLDGGVDILDIATIINHITNYNLQLTGQALINADINQDDSIDILDVIGLVHIILGTD